MIMGNRIKVGLQVRIHYKGVSLLEQGIHPSQGVLATATGTKPVAVGRKVTFKDRFQNIPLRSRTVVSLDADSRSEIVALMLLGREDNAESHHFPEFLEKAKKMNGNGADYLFSKAELSHFLREGMKKLGWV